jgi:hypothetical protein
MATKRLPKLREHEMRQLLGVPGIEGGETRAVIATSVTDATAFLRHRMNVCSAGDDGSLTVWLDDDCMWRCEFHRFKATVDSKKFRHIAAAYVWLKEWWPRLGK